MHTHWRLAFMFDAPGADLAALAEAMKRGGDTIRAAAAPHHVRMGVADRHADLAAYMASAEGGRTVRVDGAIEISIANERQSEIPALCQAMRPVLAGLADMNTVHVMTGPMHHMVPVRSGECFLSLAFRHDPAITPAQMHDWWINHHAGHAIPVLGEGLLAYDQVHVSRPVSETAAAALGVPHVAYDAYDNLTWVDRYGFLHSISDEVAMAPIYADEIGQIDPIGRRSAIMIEIH